jgi:hypothetical protein
MVTLAFPDFLDGWKNCHNVACEVLMPAFEPVSFWPGTGALKQSGITFVTFCREQVAILSQQHRSPPVNSPKHPERRHPRYRLHLPVLLKLADKEIYAQSENISLGGILLSSEVLIPEGSAIALAVRVGSIPNPGVFMTACGKVLRLQPEASGNFAIAIECSRPFELMRQKPNPSVIP